MCQSCMSLSLLACSKMPRCSVHTANVLGVCRGSRREGRQASPLSPGRPRSSGVGGGGVLEKGQRRRPSREGQGPDLPVQTPLQAGHPVPHPCPRWPCHCFASPRALPGSTAHVLGPLIPPPLLSSLSPQQGGCGSQAELTPHLGNPGPQPGGLRASHRPRPPPARRGLQSPGQEAALLGPVPCWACRAPDPSAGVSGGGTVSLAIRWGILGTNAQPTPHWWLSQDGTPPRGRQSDPRNERG